jgi:hypothetical protein
LYVQIVKLGTNLGFLQACVDAWLQVPKIAEDALLELFHILDGPAKGLESEDQGTYDVGSSDVVEAGP